MMAECKDKKIISELYASIGNGGYKFKVVDNDFGCEFSLEFDSLGKTFQKINVLMDVDSMREIGEMLIEASKAEFSENKYLGTATIRKYDTAEDGEDSGDVDPVVEPISLTKGQ